MSTSRQVTWVAVRDLGHPPHMRISHIGGIVWHASSEQALAEIQRDPYAFYVSVFGNTVYLVSGVHRGHRYLCTEADGVGQDHLLALPGPPVRVAR